MDTPKPTLEQIATKPEAVAPKAEPVVIPEPKVETAPTIAEAIAPKVESVPEPIVAPTEKAPKKERTKKAKPTLAETAMSKAEQPEEVIGEPVIEETKTQPEMKLPPDLQAKIDEANDLWEEMRQDDVRGNLHPDSITEKKARYEKLKQEAEDIANGYRQRRTMAQDGTQLG